MSDVLPLFIDRFDTPIGELLLVADGAGKLRALDWADHEANMVRLLRLHYGALMPEAGAVPRAVMEVLRRYFDGEVGGLGAIEWRTGGTAFQRAVWSGLGSGARRRCGRLALRMAPIRSAWWCRVIG